MANTIPDINVPRGPWLDVYEKTQITPGTPLIIKNRSSSAMYVFIGAEAPTTNGVIGWDIGPEEWTRCSSVPANSKVWLKGFGTAFVQVDD